MAIRFTSSGNLGDLDTNYLTLSRNIRFTVTCDGPEEFTKAARLAARNGVDSIKVNVSGDPDWGHMHADDKTPVISERELAAVAEVSATRLWALEGELEVTARCMSDLKRRGVRVLPGGDYGAFITNPIGNNAKDLELFVELSGFSPMQAIAAATRHGGQLMRKGDHLGLIKAGYQADLLVVDGNPLDDIRILQEPERLQAIMIAGKFAKRSHKLSQSPAFKAEHN